MNIVLTKTERFIVKELVSGQRYKVISGELGVSEGKVRAIMSVLFKRVGCNSRLELIVAMVRLGMIVMSFTMTLIAETPPPTITLTWTLSTTPGVTAQYICRGLGPGLEQYSPCLVQNISPATTTYVDNDPLLQRGLQYCYTAKAAVGTLTSVPSNEACGIIPLSGTTSYFPWRLPVP